MFLTIHAKQKQQNMLESRSGEQGKPQQVTASRCVALNDQEKEIVLHCPKFVQVFPETCIHGRGVFLQCAKGIV